MNYFVNNIKWQIISKISWNKKILSITDNICDLYLHVEACSEEIATLFVAPCLSNCHPKHA